jgi:hypothetical protein
MENNKPGAIIKFGSYGKVEETKTISYSSTK